MAESGQEGLPWKHFKNGVNIDVSGMVSELSYLELEESFKSVTFLTILPRCFRHFHRWGKDKGEIKDRTPFQPAPFLY